MSEMDAIAARGLQGLLKVQASGSSLSSQAREDFGALLLIRPCEVISNFGCSPCCES